MIIRLLLLFVLCLSVYGNAYGLTIHRDQLGEFQGSVVANKTRTGGSLVSTEFEDWTFEHVDRVVYRDPNISREMHRRMIWLGYSNYRAPFVEPPGLNLVVVPLQDIAGHERQNHILSFWEAKGDSLEFKFFDSKIRPGGINYLTVREVLVGKGGDFLVATECYSSDHGVFGIYEFALCDRDSQTVRHLYKDYYGMVARKAQGDTLRFELVEVENQVKARMIRTKLAYSKGEKEKYGNQWVRTVTKVDTTMVDLFTWEQ